VARFYAQVGGSFDNRFEEAGMETRTTTRLREQDKRILDKKTFAHLATLMPDGSPQVTPVWVDYEGDRIVVNSAEGRAKPRNVREDPRVALSATDPDNPYEAVIVRGESTSSRTRAPTSTSMRWRRSTSAGIATRSDRWASSV